jgi:hypothetical protein
MGYNYFSIPVVSEIQNKESWIKSESKKDRYSILRFHYMLRGPFLVDKEVRKGEIIGAAIPLKGSKTNIKYSTTYEYTKTVYSEAIKESLVEQELTSSLSAAVNASLGAELTGKLGTEAKSEISSRLLQSYKKSYKFSVSDTFCEKKEVSCEFAIDPQGFPKSTSLVVFAPYTKYAYNLYLQMVDHLTVFYETKPLRLRKRRYKQPDTTIDPHPNIIHLHLPLFTFIFWKQMVETPILIEQKDYSQEINDPDEVLVKNFEDQGRYPVKSMPPKPTLYDISEEIFPSKIWI